MSAVAGLLGLGSHSGAVTSGEEWVSEYQGTILVRNSKGMNVGTTLFGLMAKLPNEVAETTEYKWFERDPVKRVVYAAADVAQAGTTLTLDDGAAGSVYGIVQPGSVLLNPATGEGVRVTAYSGGNYTIVRSFIGSAPAGTDSIADDAQLIVITLAKDEGALPAASVYEAPGTLYNYIQTFNSTVELANAFKGSQLRTDIDGPLKERRVQALERIARDIELAYFMGAKARVAGTNGWQYFTGGVKQAVDGIGDASYVLNGQTTTGVTLAVFKSWLETFMTQGSDVKLALAGPKAYAAISNYANDASGGFRITGAETVFGMNIQTILTPFGEVSLAMHPLFKEISEYQDWMFVLDLPMLAQKYMEPLFLEPNIQTPGQDAYKEQFRAKYGLKMKFAQAFGYAYDLQKIT